MPGYFWQSRDNKAPQDINLDICTDNILEGERKLNARGSTASFAARQEPIFFPKEFDEAMACPDEDKWKAFMDVYINSLLENNTWKKDAVDLPEGREAVSGRWVYAVKTHASGVVGGQRG